MKTRKNPPKYSRYQRAIQKLEEQKMTKVETAAIANMMSEKDKQIEELRAKLNKFENGGNGKPEELPKLPFVKPAELQSNGTYTMEIAGKIYGYTGQFGYKINMVVKIGSRDCQMGLTTSNRGLPIVMEGLRQGKYKFEIEKASFMTGTGKVDYIKINKAI